MNESVQISRLDSLTCPLDGINLIEAGAGTGKTYNIQNLVVRLLVEKEMTIDQIAVVTYTDAATAELRDRIRTILNNIHSMLHLGVCADPKDRDRVEKLVRRFTGLKNPEICGKIILDAIRSFDDACISTIHGFCRRILSENSFESGILFNVRLEKNINDIVDSLTADFYRREFYPQDDDSMLKYALSVNMNIVLDRTSQGQCSLKEISRKFIGRPDLRLNTGFDRSSCDLGMKFAELKSSIVLLSEKLPAALPILDSLKGLLNQPYSEDEIDETKAVITSLCESRGKDYAALLKVVSGLDRNRIRGKINRRKKSNEVAVDGILKANAAFFDEIEKTQCIVREYAASFKASAADYCNTELEKLKSRDNFQTFDDLLRRVDARLEAGDTKLLNVLRSKMKAAIVDEFQDTDPVQYRIFRRIFAESAEHSLFMVGDPRQSIYAFRGGDIAAYIGARAYAHENGGRQSTLDVNYRSSRNMIKAVSRLFGEHPYPFASEQIHFGTVSSPDANDNHELDGLSISGDADEFPLRFNYLKSDDGKGLSSEKMKKHSFQFCADKILELLESENMLVPTRGDGGQYMRIRPNDIAVLVREHRNARAMKELLAAYRIPAVISQADSVFASDEAKEMLAILQSVSIPRRSDLVSDALMTSSLGIEPDELVKICSGTDSQVFSEWQAYFCELLTKWKKTSFIEMFDDLLNRFSVREKLLGRPNGERSLTNLLQLAEILHVKSEESDLGPDSVIYYLQTQMNSDMREENEEYELRLETDRSAVRIMTVHKSKGLEFPIVFLPDLFEYRVKGGRMEAYHTADGGSELDLTGSADTEKLSADEQLQEILRLTYVAITRAKHRCYIVWGDCIENHRTSGLDWLFRTRGLPELPPLGRLISAIESSASGPSALIPSEWLEEPAAMENLPNHYVPEEPVKPDSLTLPEWHSEIDFHWTVTSYSGLTPSGGDDVPGDVDQVDNSGAMGTSPDSDKADIFEFPAGAKVGNAWHEIFEDIDFTSADEQIISVVSEKLRHYGLVNENDPSGQHRVDVTGAMVRSVLSASLPMKGTDDVFSLDMIGRGDRLSELGFNFAFTSPFSTGQIEDVLRKYALERFGLNSWPEWDRYISGGFMTGFIDLVFRYNGKYCLADWKSNLIGAKFRNFEQKGLCAEMSRHFYFLQYLFYTAALMKFLRQRLGIRLDTEAEYNKYIGGIYYIFLRGVAPDAPGRGIFYEHVPFGLMRRLEEILR